MVMKLEVFSIKVPVAPFIHVEPPPPRTLNYFAAMFNLKTKKECFVNFNFFFLKEYEIDAGWDMTPEQLILAFISSCFFMDSFIPSVSLETIHEFPIQDIKAVATNTLHGPFVIEYIGMNDFQKIKGSALKDTLLDYGEKAGSGMDEGAVSNIRQSLLLLEKFEIDEDDVFHLNKDQFTVPDKAVTGFASIYDYYLLFLLVNQNRNRLLLLKYGAD